MATSTAAERAEFEARLANAEQAAAQSRSFIEQSRLALAEMKARRPKATTDTAFRVFAKALDSQGLRSALVYLRGLTEYRFVSIFRFENGHTVCVAHVDRDDPTSVQTDAAPTDSTYCCYVRDTNGAFITADALLDPRTEGHAKRGVVSAYCGIPIMDSEGVLFGTLCHYDTVPRDPEALDLPLLLRAASRLAQSGLIGLAAAPG